MTCTTAVDLLPDLLDGGMDGADRRDLDAHLSECAGCAAELEFLRELRDVRPEPPEGALPELRQAILRAGIPLGSDGVDGGDGVGGTDVTPIQAAPARGSRVRDWRWSLPAAAVLVLSLGSLQLWRELSSPEPALDIAAEVALLDDAVLEAYGGDDGLVAGAALIEDLTDDALQSLLDELAEGEGSI